MIEKHTTVGRIEFSDASEDIADNTKALINALARIDELELTLKNECESHEKTIEVFNHTSNLLIEQAKKIVELGAEKKQLKIALADATRSPMGVLPTSAEGLLTHEEIEAAEEQRLQDKRGLSVHELARKHGFPELTKEEERRNLEHNLF